MWSDDTGDANSGGNAVEAGKAVYDQAAQRYPSPGISLQHEVYQSTAWELVPYAIQVSAHHPGMSEKTYLMHPSQRMTGAGYQLTTVPGCTGISPYQ